MQKKREHERERERERGRKKGTQGFKPSQQGFLVRNVGTRSEFGEGSRVLVVDDLQIFP